MLAVIALLLRKLHRLIYNDALRHIGLEHKLVLLVWMDDAKVFIPIDVSEAVWKAIDSGERNVNIETQNLGIDLRKFIGSSENSFDVIFDDWEEEEEELPV